MEGDYVIFNAFYLKTIISIHALRVEGDDASDGMEIECFAFLSTPSGWRATVSFADRLGKIDISIHALRVEGDTAIGKPREETIYFYPRPPGGGRPSEFHPYTPAV